MHLRRGFGAGFLALGLLVQPCLAQGDDLGLSFRDAFGVEEVTTCSVFIRAPVNGTRTVEENSRCGAGGLRLAGDSLVMTGGLQVTFAPLVFDRTASRHEWPLYDADLDALCRRLDCTTGPVRALLAERKVGAPVRAWRLGVSGYGKETFAPRKSGCSLYIMDRQEGALGLLACADARAEMGDVMVLLMVWTRP